MTHDDLRRYLITMSASFRHLGSKGGGWLMEEFVLREGIDCIAQPLPDDYSRGPMKRCFHNTGKMVKRRKRGLTYCEGFVLRAAMPIAIHHAWAIDDDQRVIDVTLSDPEACIYRGVPIPRCDLIAMTTDESASVFMDAIGMLRWEYMVQRCPALRVMLA